jgi:hypothetical protein
MWPAEQCYQEEQKGTPKLSWGPAILLPKFQIYQKVLIFGLSERKFA